MATWDEVRRLVFALPETSEEVSWGHAHWRVKGKGFVWERPLRRPDLEALGNQAPDGPILGVSVEHVGIKEALLAEKPDVFFTIPHFDGYAAVLVRLDRIEGAELADLIQEAWLARAPKRLVKDYLSGR